MKMQFSFSFKEFFLVLAGLTLTAGLDLEIKFRNTQYSDVIFVDDVTFESTETSRVHCAAQCSKRSDVDCATFTFTPGSGGSKVGTCRGHSLRKTQGDRVMVKENTKAFHRLVPDIPTCRSGWARFGNSCYMFQAALVPYSEAKIQCEAMNSYLAEVESIEESLFVSNVSAGLNDMATEGQFVLTSSGKAATFTYWASKEPNDSGDQDCVGVSSINSLIYPGWNDVWCADPDPFYQLPSVCEYSLE